MKRRLLFSLLLAAALVLGLVSCALADYVPIKISMSVSPKSMSGPRTVDVSVKITNVGDSDLPGSVSLLDPAGNAVTDFGDGGSTTLSLGASMTWSGTWKVTEKQLNAGKITYQVKYPIYDEEKDRVVLKNKYFSVALTKTAAEPSLSVKRTISPTMAKKGQTVNVIYELENTGSVEIDTVKVKENTSISKKTQTVDTLPVGEKTQITFEATMGTKNLTSQGTVTYKGAGNNKTYTEKLDKAAVTYGESKLSADLKASAATVNIGETVKLELTISNAGNIDYPSVKVTDPVLGEVFTNQELPAGATKVLTKEVTLQNTATFDFTVAAADNAGGEESLKADSVTVQAIDPSKKLSITLNASADRAEIYEEPSVVRFTVTATNTSEVDAKTVTVKSGDTTVYTFDNLKAGQTKHFVRDVSASMAGQYQFVANTKDLLGNAVSFESNVVRIAYSAPTPAPTEAPVRTPPPLQLDPPPTTDGLPQAVGTVQHVAYTLCFVLGAFLLLTLALIGAALIRRAAAKHASDAAMDHLERGTRRDYTVEPDEADGEERHTFPSGEEDDLFDIELPDEAEPHQEAEEGEDGDRGESSEKTLTPAGEGGDEQAPSETAQDKAAEPAAEEEAPPEERAAIVSSGDGSYRLSRQSSQPAVASAQEFSRRRASRMQAPSAGEDSAASEAALSRPAGAPGRVLVYELEEERQASVRRPRTRRSQRSGSLEG